MKRTLTKSLYSRTVILSLVIALLMAAVPASPAGAAKPGSSSWKYTALGDSLATGFGASQGYVPRYKNHIQTSTGMSVSLTNLGQNGWTSADLLDALKTDRKFRSSVKGSPVVTWDIGGNDFRNARDKYKSKTCGGSDNQDCLRAAESVFKFNWDAIVTEILLLRSTSNTIIRTMDIYNPYVSEDQTDTWTGDDGSNDFQVFKPYLDRINGHIAETATANHIPHAQVYIAFNGPDGTEDPWDKGYLWIDGLHPNDKGHQVIADEFHKLGYAPLR